MCGISAKNISDCRVPSHPRSINWRDYRPKVAIIRLPDGDYGLEGQPWFRNRLLGNRDHPSDEASREWLKVWPILTHGKMRAGAAAYLNNFVYPEVHDAATYPDFFVPIDSVAVFDHTVTSPALQSVDCFIVCGHALSAETHAALRQRALSGATVIISSRLDNLYPSLAPAPATWHVIDDFTDPQVAALIQPFLGEPSVSRWRFNDAVVEFRPGAVKDAMTVRVFERKIIAEYAQSLVGARPIPTDGDLNNDAAFNLADLVLLIKKLE